MGGAEDKTNEFRSYFAVNNKSVPARGLNLRIIVDIELHLLMDVKSELAFTEVRRIFKLNGVGGKSSVAALDLYRSGGHA